jgi:hypothetical protein
MTTEEKGRLIGLIILTLRTQLRLQRERMPWEKPAQPFDEGDTFFALAFKPDDELKRIARMVGA